MHLHPRNVNYEKTAGEGVPELAFGPVPAMFFVEDYVAGSQLRDLLVALDAGTHWVLEGVEIALHSLVPWVQVGKPTLQQRAMSGPLGCCCRERV